MVLNGIGMNLISTIVKPHDKLASFFIHGRCLVKISYLLIAMSIFCIYLLVLFFVLDKTQLIFMKIEYLSPYIL